MVSVIILTLNAENYIRGLLKSLTGQSIPIEIIVVDSSSSDNTVKIAESFGIRPIIIKRGDFDHGGTRNLAIKHTGGGIICFLTHDTLPANEHTIENLIKPFTDEKIGATYGRQLSYPDASPFAVHLRLFNYTDTSYVRSLGDRNIYGLKTLFLSNSFAAYRRKVLEEIGGFKENLILAEDIYAGAKILLAGYKIAYVSDTILYHSHNYTIFQEFKRYFDIGVFHKRENWIIKEFGKAEGEGKKYIQSELRFLVEFKKYQLIPEFFIRNSLKYIGYKAGQNYGKLPKLLVKRLSMHKDWWNNQKGESK